MLLIVLAFARPYLRPSNSQTSASASQEGVVFVVDRSLSMRSEKRWQQARERVQILANTLAADTELALVVFDRTPRLVCSSVKQRDHLLTELAGCQPGYADTNLLAALRLGLTTAEQMQVQNRQLYLVSDFQTTSVNDLVLEFENPAGVRIMTVPIAKKSPYNAAVTGVLEKDTEQRDRRSLQIVLAGYGEGRVEGTLGIYHDDRCLIDRPVQVADTTRIVETFTWELDPNQAFTLCVRLAVHDGLVADNAFYIHLPPRKTLDVLYCVPTGNRSPYLEAAASALGPRVDIRWTDPAKLASALGSRPRVVVMDQTDTADGPALTALRTAVDAGSIAILFPGNRWTEDLAKLSGCSDDGWISLDSQKGEHRLVSISSSASSFTRLNEAGYTVLGYPHVFRYLRLNPQGDTEALIRLDDNTPFLLGRRLGQGMLYTFTVPLDSKAGDYMLRAGFSPLLYQLFEIGVERTSFQHAFRVGQILSTVSNASPNTLLDPRGQELNASEGAVYAEQPGIYRYEQMDQERILVVNTEPRESDLTCLSSERIHQINQETPSQKRVTGNLNQAGPSATPQDPDQTTRGW